jgi:hypothetical protein
LSIAIIQKLTNLELNKEPVMDYETRGLIQTWLNEHQKDSWCTCGECRSFITNAVDVSEVSGPSLSDGICIKYEVRDQGKFVSIVLPESVIVQKYVYPNWETVATNRYDSFDELHSLLDRDLIEEYIDFIKEPATPKVSESEEEMSNLKVDDQGQLEVDEVDLDNSMWDEVPEEIRELAKKAKIGIEDLSELVVKLAELKKDDKQGERENTVKMAEINKALEVELAKIQKDRELSLAKVRATVETRNKGDIEISQIRWKYATKTIVWATVAVAIAVVVYIAAGVFPLPF